MRTCSAAALLVAVAATLTGCALLPPAPPFPTVAVEVVDVPDAMLRHSAEVELLGPIAAPGDRHPWVIGGRTRATGAAWKPAYWVSDDGEQWVRQTLPGVEGSFWGTFHAGPELVAIGGTLWHEGMRRSALWVSDDAETWLEVRLPGGFRDEFRISMLAVSGDALVALGSNDAGEARFIHLVDGALSEFAAPDTGGQPLGPIALALDGDAVVLVARPGPDGEPAPIVAYTSPDRGAHWNDQTPLAGELDRVNGIAVVGDGFVATGGIADPATGDRRAAAWSSRDGATWAVETVPRSEQTWLDQDQGSAGIGMPSVADGVVTAMKLHSSSLLGEVLWRSPEGTWEALAPTDLGDATGFGGSAIRTAEATIGFVTGRGGARLGVVRDGTWETTATLSRREDPAVPVDVQADGDHVIVEAARTVFTSTPNSWTRRPHAMFFALDDGVLSEAPADAPVELRNPTRATEGDATVLLGTSPVDDAPRGWFRPTADSDWVAATGLATDLSVQYSQVALIGGRWIAVGGARADLYVGSDYSAASWTSLDGVTWVEASVAPEGHPSIMLSVCELPDGTPIAFGELEHEPGRTRAAVWTLEGTTWQEAPGGALTRGDGHAAECIATDHGVLTRASIDGRLSLVLGTDANTWTEVMRPERGSSIAHPTRVAGGYAATGYVGHGPFAGPVIWLSRDGAQWRAVGVPGDGDFGIRTIASVGDDLLVLMVQGHPHPVMLIRDIGALIERG